VYAQFFHLREMPFSITPDPAYLYLSPRHQEALGHLLYGTGQYGGFVQLTGEVGTGKTTVVRTLLAQTMDGVDVAMIHNPRQSEREFVQSVCDEFGIRYAAKATLKQLVDGLNALLLEAHAAGRRQVLIIDEAQNLDPGVLEQVRLLTNLETHKEKLLRIMLVGQPELTELLGRPELRQLAQRITARYHLTPLSRPETLEYIRHRLRVAGGAPELFRPDALELIHEAAGGVPRLINVLCDRALLGAYGAGSAQVTAEIARTAIRETRGQGQPALPAPAGGGSQWARRGELALATLAVLLSGTLLYQNWRDHLAPAAAADPVPASAAPAAAPPPASSAETPALDALAQPLPQLIQSLIRLWQPSLRVPVDSGICRALRGEGLECYRGTADWEQLRQMNRPAILVLDLDGQKRHVLLTRLDGQQAELAALGGRQPLPLAALDAAWSGEFLLLWRRETPDTLIGPQTRGESVVWLRKRLAAISRQPLNGPLSGFFDPELGEAVRRFQAFRGLDVDGVAGIRTLIALGDQHPDTPMLSRSP
jgi:general secretion pathway protein A